MGTALSHTHKTPQAWNEKNSFFFQWKKLAWNCLIGKTESKWRCRGKHGVLMKYSAATLTLTILFYEHFRGSSLNATGA